jgi:hypothetical protein
MDNKQPQSGGHVGHDESELSIKGVLWFGVFLVVGGILAFASMYGFNKFLHNVIVESEPKMSPMEKQLHDQRDVKTSAQNGPATEEEAAMPENYAQGHDRKWMEAHLKETFPGPRLQFDDEHDMTLFRESENEWLSSTGKNSSGDIHIPVDRAIDLITQRGLPPVSGSWQPPTLPTAVPMVPAQTAAARK